MHLGDRQSGPHPLHRAHQGRADARRRNGRTRHHSCERRLGADAAVSTHDRRAQPSRGPGAEPVLRGNRRRRRVQAVQPRVVRYFPGDASRWLLGGRCAQADRSGERARFERPDRAGRPAVMAGQRQRMAARRGGCARGRRLRRPGGVRRHRQSRDGTDRCARLLLVGLERPHHQGPSLRLWFRAGRAGGDVREHRRPDVQGAARGLDDWQLGRQAERTSPGLRSR